jgi:hypothetical protein
VAVSSTLIPHDSHGYPIDRAHLFPSRHAQKSWGRCRSTVCWSSSLSPVSTPPPSAAPTSLGAGATGIEITAKFFPLAFMLNFFKPTIVINGSAQKGA